MIIHESMWRDISRLVVWFPLRWFLPRLPPSLSLKIFRLMGSVLYVVDVKKQTMVREILRKTFRDLHRSVDLTAEVKRYFQHHICNSLFPFLVERLTEHYLRSRTEIRGLHHLEEALSHGKGCILIQGHVGPVQFPLVFLRQKGYKLGQVYYRHIQGLSLIGSSIQLKYREEMEQKLGAEMFAVNAYQRPMYRWLKAGNVLMMSGDGIGGLRFIGYYSPFPFMGKEMLFPMGPYQLSLKLNTPILPIHVTLEGSRFGLQIKPPLKTDKTGDRAVEDLARQFISQLEQEIISSPHTWHFWDGFRKGMLIPDNDR